MVERATWKSILIGIVSGALLVYVVRPLLDHVSSAVFGIAQAISQRGVDFIFADAARQRSLEGFLLVLTALVLVLCSIPVLTGRRLTDPPHRSFTSGGMVGLALSLLLLSMLRVSSSGLTECFRNRVAVLSPYLSESETKELTAAWTLMRSRADYDAILKKIAEHGEKHNLHPLIEKVCPGYR